MDLPEDSVAYKCRLCEFIDQYCEKFPDKDGSAYEAWKEFLEDENNNKNKYKWFKDPEDDFDPYQ